MSDTVIFWVSGAADSLLELDRPEKWPGIETLATSRFTTPRGFRATRTKVRMPIATARSMLDDCRSRGAQQVGGEGWDQDASGTRACRQLFERLAALLDKTG